MDLQRSTENDTPNKRKDDFQGEIVYDSLDDKDDDSHPYTAIKSAEPTTNSGSNKVDSKGHPYDTVIGNSSMVRTECSRRAICLALLGVMLFCTLICVLSGVIVYYVIKVRMADTESQTREYQDIMDMNKRLATLNNTIQALEKTQKVFDIESRDGFTDTTRRFDALDNTLQVIREKQNISGQQVAFTVHGATGTLVNTVLTFRNVILNAGDGYNQTTGKFRCPVAGTYIFSATLQSVHSRGNSIWCSIRKNDIALALVESYEGPRGSASGSMIVHLSIGDYVDLGSCGHVNYIITNDIHTVFLGSLIQSD